ncbi:MAG TPA: hypothetical protein VGO99_01110 [Leifsonia sp.]|jgi:hypothetical protein|nr:hypothetical protein [Microbacteriaceae bacterium]HEV7811530.1 hypothetical protein [Leifsonia sp.]
MRSAAAKQERTPRGFWFDPRFGIGLALVLASIIGVVWLVSAADRTVQVWAAREALSPGDTVRGEDLVLRNVRLGEAGRLYLGSEQLTSSGLMVTRAVAAGELLPTSAVGARDGARVASVVVMVSGQLPQSVAAGSVVDLWSAREVETGVFGPPSVLVSSATVVRVVESEGFIVDGAGVGVEVLVPRSRIALMLEAIANADALSLVPASLPLGG